MEYLTAREQIKLHGKVSDITLDRLIEAEESLEKISDIDSYLIEARSQYPNEDFLSDVKERLGDLAKKLRGPNRFDLQMIIKQLDEIEITSYNATEYGIEQIEKALTEIEGE